LFDDKTLRIEEANIKLESIVKELEEKQDIKPSTIVKEGNIFDTISAAADEIGAKFIVMGTHGMKGMQYVTGSWALRVITNSNAPFVVVQERGIRKGYKNIVLPMDFSRECKAALTWAVFIGKYFNSKVHLFAVNVTDEYHVKYVNNNLGAAKTILSKNKVPFTIKRAEEKGDFVQQTISYASSLDADLIMLITHQPKGVKEFIFEPHEVQIMSNEAQIPAMCINPRDDVYIRRSVLIDFGM